jgi:23S rRNA (uracil1939-C5)-methyltransferase
MKKHSSAPHAIPSSGASPAERPNRSAEQVTVAIEAMGAQGHGVARIDGATAHIPFTLPGETVRAELKGHKAVAAAIESASPERIEPVCKHFGTCGGCALQHWRNENYEEWKEGLVRAALARVGLEVPMERLKTYPISSRRRATFTARKANGRLDLGHNAARSHDVVGLDECPILLPRIALALPHLKAALESALTSTGEAKVHMTAASNGLDCVIQGPRLHLGAQANFIQALAAAGVIRAIWNDEAILLSATPFASFGGVRVALPPGAFLQAVEACEHDMAAFVIEALAEANAARGHICDLFAGLGAFTFPCAKFAQVTAYEESAAAVPAIVAATREAKGIKPVMAVRRDLFRNPLGPAELNKFAAIVADPPREGAEAQCRALASSEAETALMLSCNPVTFARDAALLTAGGFRLARVAAFDQFRFSSHVEIAASFRRPRSKRGGRASALGLAQTRSTRRRGFSSVAGMITSIVSLTVRSFRTPARVSSKPWTIAATKLSAIAFRSRRSSGAAS